MGTTHLSRSPSASSSAFCWSCHSAIGTGIKPLSNQTSEDFSRICCWQCAATRHRMTRARSCLVLLFQASFLSIFVPRARRAASLTFFLSILESSSSFRFSTEIRVLNRQLWRNECSAAAAVLLASCHAHHLTAVANFPMDAAVLASERSAAVEEGAHGADPATVLEMTAEPRVAFISLLDSDPSCRERIYFFDGMRRQR